eukprot:TRINITY_DN7111_c0_g2_i4.p1 TRINITY_DN7111_c0_g2~~TRINITY_DN7111_c0_g2_i4.p1  ORF type:complete len:679 (+),score=205.47 TRINITY_DN7111_c0_g2_i4:745-2781(+)
MEYTLTPIGAGKHKAVTIDEEGVVLGRGEVTNIWKAELSRQHCHVSIQDGALKVRPLGRNPLIVLKGGKTSKSYKLEKGRTDTLENKDRVALLPSGEYLYEVSPPEGLPGVREDSPNREDDEDSDSVDAIAPLGTFCYTRVPSTKQKSLSDIDKAPSSPVPVKEKEKEKEADEPTPEPEPEPEPEAEPEAVEPAAKKQKLLPVCKYGATCTRKNPAHFLEYDHPKAGAVVDPKDLPKCKYGVHCTRKNPQHFKDCYHPPKDATALAPPAPAVPAPDAPAPAAVDTSTTAIATGPPAPAPAPAPAGTITLTGAGGAVDVTDLALRKTQEMKGVVPTKYMPEDELVLVSSGGGEQYKMKFTHQGYYCTCIAWRYQNKAVNERTCKHLKEYLGAEFERVRCGVQVGAAAKAGAALNKKFPMQGVLLAEKWDEKRNLAGWYTSEKLDGVRAYWDGERFLSRNGNCFTAPDWFKKDIPPGVHLDGELFGGRGKFQTTVSVVKSSNKHDGWKNLTYEVFDIPSVAAKWEDRMKAMEETLADAGPYIKVVKQTLCVSNKQLLEDLDKITALKAEGLMMRQPGSMYVRARSSTLLKAKKFCDCEALVKAHDVGKGKHSDKMGALVCVLPNGKQFNVGTGFTDVMRLNPPKVGAVITVKYQELTTGGIPRFPVFIGERIDATWPPQA